jgi:hypothetical protein
MILLLSGRDETAWRRFSMHYVLWFFAMKYKFQVLACTFHGMPVWPSFWRGRVCGQKNQQGRGRYPAVKGAADVVAGSQP